MKYRILIVDDDAEIRDVLSGLLTLKGYEVLTAKDGLAAVSEVTQYRPDLMILDVSMPRMSGFQTCQAIRKTKGFERLPVIFLTAKKSEADKKYGERIGGDVYLTKPYNQNELLFTVDKILKEKAPLTTERTMVDKVKPDTQWQD